MTYRAAIVQLVPGLPPRICGVGDYALALARALRSEWGILSSLLVCDPEWSGAAEIEGFPVCRIEHRGPLALAAALGTAFERLEPSVSGAEARTALLQLSPYGFGANGCPFWLTKGLRLWKGEAATSTRRLITTFHETYAMSAPWRRAFWVSPFQRIVIKRIHALTDSVFTSTNRYAEYLRSLDGRPVTAVTPIFSNVGEPNTLAPLDARRRRMVVFGLAATRRRIYAAAVGVIQEIVRKLGINEVVDIGPPLERDVFRRISCPVTEMGVLSDEAVSTTLADSAFGLVALPVPLLAKSTVFAACCAHGVIPILIDRCGAYEGSGDGLREGIHFVRARDAAGGMDRARLCAISEGVRRWYSSHRISVHAANVAQHMAQNGGCGPA